MKLFIANKNYSSWSLRPWVLMTTLGLPFEESVHPFPMGGGPCGFEAFSPSGKVPVLVDGENTVWDTLAIAEYLAEQHAAVLDAFFCPVAFRVQTYGLPLSEVCQAYVDSLLALPSMQAWYQAALKEPWLEPAHDAEVLAFGDLVQDDRSPA